LHATAVRHHVQAVAQRLEDELGPEQFSFIEGCPRDWAELPRPDLPLVVGLDGGYVHSSTQRSRRDGWFEVIAGKVIPDQGPARCFSYVQTYDKKPKRRLFEVLASQGMQANQQVTFLTDGDEDIRDLPLYLTPQAEHLLDWFHITMRLTVMTNMAKSLPPPADPDRAPPPEGLATNVGKELERIKWFLWHGNVFRALQTVQDLEIDLDVEEPSVSQTKLLKAVREFGGYLTANASCIPNYGERRRAGETISTSFVESTVNQVISKRMVKKTADALEPPQCAPAPPDTHPHPQRHPHQRLPTLVPQLHPHPRSTAPGRITSHGFSHSRLVAWSQVVKQVFISWRYWVAVSR